LLKLRLEIIKEIYKPNSRGYDIRFYTCKCICGTIKDIKAWDFNRNIFSCGCLHKEICSNKTPHNKLPIREAVINILYKNYYDRSNKKHIEFSLTKEDFKKLLFNNCYYCNCKPNQITKDKAKKQREDLLHNGIDRKNSNLGYTIDNCVSCCKTCNYGKRNLTEEDWFKYLNQLVNYRKELK